MVSFTTLNWDPPSSRNSVPWLPATVAQPSRSSLKALHRTRITPAESSRSGPSKTSTTSLVSSLRTKLLSLMLLASVMAVSLMTLKNNRTNLKKASRVIEVSPSSRQLENILAMPSDGSSATSNSGGSVGASEAAVDDDDEDAVAPPAAPSLAASASTPPATASSSPGVASAAAAESAATSAASSAATASPSLAASPLAALPSSLGFWASGAWALKSRSFSSFSAPSKKATKSDWQISPSPFLSKAAKSASLPQPRIRWLYRTTLRAKTLSFSASTVRFLKACSRNLEDRFVVRPSRGSILPIRISSCLACEARKACKSLAKRASKPSPSVSICFLDCVTEALASLMTSSTSSASSIIAEADMAFAFSCKGWTFCSAMPTALSASSTVNEASLILSANSFFRP
mmetsp:Transcript_60458/g.158473  ORF Transcript_60458/g.158473 Transcript_60458/m.158473 type:complete len:403 (-) Transcript_60458:1196-2404(-)